MPLFLVACELPRPSPRNRHLPRVLRELGDFAPTIDAAWLLNAPLTAAELRERLAEHLEAEDRVVIAELTGSLATHGPGAEPVWQWAARQVAAARADEAPRRSGPED